MFQKNDIANVPLPSFLSAADERIRVQNERKKQCPPQKNLNLGNCSQNIKGRDEELGCILPRLRSLKCLALSSRILNCPKKDPGISRKSGLS